MTYIKAYPQMFDGNDENKILMACSHIKSGQAAIFTQRLQRLQTLKQDRMTIDKYGLHMAMLISEADIDPLDNASFFLSIVKRNINLNLVRKVYTLQTGPPSYYDTFLKAAQ